MAPGPKSKARRGAGSAPRLAAEAWVLAGLRALVKGGVGAVHVEHLARDLAVTKGSFYWHFVDRDALLDAMAAHWEEIATSAVIAQIGSAGPAAERLERLLDLTTSGKADRLEGAMRAWGAVTPRVGAVVARVDRRREKFVVALFEELGFAADEAVDRTRALYLALIGELTRTAHGATPSGPRVWRSLRRALTARAPAD